MPIHDWKKEFDWLFKSFHLGWVLEISKLLNQSLPSEFYSLLEPDSSKLEGVYQGPISEDDDDGYYSRRTKDLISIRQTETDRVISVIEIICPNDKSEAARVEEVISRVCGLLNRGIHVLLVDLFPPTLNDPNGLHFAIWHKLENKSVSLQNEQTRVAVSYECDPNAFQAYVEPLALGDVLPSMPVFLEPGGCVMVPLEATYTSAYESVPARWRKVIEG
jgi:hypothetical protein